MLASVPVIGFLFGEAQEVIATVSVGLLAIGILDIFRSLLIKLLDDGIKRFISRVYETLLQVLLRGAAPSILDTKIGTPVATSNASALHVSTKPSIVKVYYVTADGKRHELDLDTRNAESMAEELSKVEVEGLEVDGPVEAVSGR